MTCMEAWKIISGLVKKVYISREKLGIEPYNEEEIKAQIMVFRALKLMEEAQELDDDGK